MPDTAAHPLVHLPQLRADGRPNPAEKIQVTMGDKTFDAGRRTAAHLEWTIARLAKKHPGTHLHVIQSCYHTGVKASARTHDGDGVFDIRIDGMKWLKAQKFLRRSGWAAWFRPESPDWVDHVHSVSIGCPGPVGDKIPHQIEDYHEDRDGLDAHGPDGTWRPDDIDATVFDYPKYLRDQHDLDDTNA
jgi:hypothetical protein